MNWLDIVLIVSLVIPTVIGLRQGLIKSVLSLVGLIVGVILAGIFYEALAGLLTFIPNIAIANVVAFIIILVGIMLIAAKSDYFCGNARVGKSSWRRYLWLFNGCRPLVSHSGYLGKILRGRGSYRIPNSRGVTG